MKNRFLLLFPFALGALPAMSIAAPKMSPDMKAADLFITKAFGPYCDRQSTDGFEPDLMSDERFEITYKDDYDAEDRVFPLFQMHCSHGAYNEALVYLTQDEDGNFRILSFADPQASYEYEDEKETKLKQPPKLAGMGSTLTLTNADFDPETNTITSANRWRGLGDAYDSGTFVFSKGNFVLKKFVVDPIYEANLPESEAAALAEKSFTLFSTE